MADDDGGGGGNAAVFAAVLILVAVVVLGVLFMNGTFTKKQEVEITIPTR